MKVLEDLLVIAATRVRLAKEAHDQCRLRTRARTFGARAAAARAYADVATAVATYKHNIAMYATQTAKASQGPFWSTPEMKELGAEHAIEANRCLREAEQAELVAHAAKEQASQLEAM